MKGTIWVSLQLLSTAEGGRADSILSGYRSLARFQNTEADFGFELELDSEGLDPGHRGAGRLTFWVTDELPDLSPGQSFELREGTRVVGHGMILERGLEN